MSENNSQHTIRERAQAALAMYREQLAENRRREQEQFDKAKAGELRDLLKRVLDLDVKPVGPTIELDGVVFGTYDDDGATRLVILGKCMACGDDAPSEAVTSWAIVGAILEHKTFHPSRHHTRYVCSPPLTKEPQETPTDRLVSALRELLGLEAQE